MNSTDIQSIDNSINQLINYSVNQLRIVEYPSSVTLFMLCGLIIFTIIMYNFRKNVFEALQSLFNYRRTQRMFEERRESDRQMALISNILFSLAVGIFVSLLFPFFGAKPLWGNYTLSILFFSVTINLLFNLKARFWKLLGVVFVAQSFSKNYINSMFLFNHIAGIIAFPLVMIIPYIAENIAPFVVYSVISVFVISYFL